MLQVMHQKIHDIKNRMYIAVQLLASISNTIAETYPKSAIYLWPLTDLFAFCRANAVPAHRFRHGRPNNLQQCQAPIRECPSCIVR